MKINKKNKILITFSAISLTDIVLLLLIFFLLSSSFVVNTGIKVDLPSSDSSEASIKQLMTITVTGNGEIFVNEKRKVTIDNIRPVINEELTKFESKSVLLKADKDIPINIAIKIMDAVKISGGSDITIATTKEN